MWAIHRVCFQRLPWSTQIHSNEDRVWKCSHGGHRNPSSNRCTRKLVRNLAPLVTRSVGRSTNHWHKRFSRGWEPFLAPWPTVTRIVSLGRVLSFAQWQVLQGHTHWWPYLVFGCRFKGQPGGAFSGAWGTGASMWGEKLQYERSFSLYMSSANGTSTSILHCRFPHSLPPQAVSLHPAAVSPVCSQSPCSSSQILCTLADIFPRLKHTRLWHGPSV